MLMNFASSTIRKAFRQRPFAGYEQMLRTPFSSSAGASAKGKAPSPAVPLQNVLGQASSQSKTQPETTQIRRKFKIPQKRASSLLFQLRWEEYDKLKAGREWPIIKAGDAIQISRLMSKTATRPTIVRGVVVGIRRKFADTSVEIINNEKGTPIYRHFKMYDPLITDIRIVQKAFIHDGKKRVRRSKIYYYWNKNPEQFTVTFKQN